MPDFNQILNFVIPVAIFLFIFSLLYTKFKETFNTMFSFIKNIFIKVSSSGSNAKGKMEERIVYR